ncbi:MAG: xanthine dehydrogenase family protein molybdopterin-binding subunit [Nitrospinaceae bacterium]|nr:xanthine dehydrogenase family protein molybdopterin-binding subunit [Nitrospinaceae bacterium]
MIQQLSRRDFIKISSTAGAGLIMGITLPYKERLVAAGIVEQTFEPNVWVSIHLDNTITIMAAKSEMGQDIRTSLPMIVAEELEADWSQVKVAQADAHPDKYGSQGTGGSGSIRRSFTRLRKAGATAREMLIQAAANKWDISPTECRAEKGKILHVSSGRSFTFGELAEAASKLPAPDDPQLKPPKDFKLIGRSMSGLDTPSRVNGTAQFGMDVQVPNMVYTTVLRCPTFGGKIKSFNPQKAKKVNGVIDAFEIDEGVAIVGKNTWAVIKGQQALDVDWDHGGFANWDSKQIKDMMEKKGAGKAIVAREDGNVFNVKDDQIIKAQYEVPFTHHATMEPMNCVVHVKRNACEIWAPTQVPQRIQTTAAKYLGMDVKAITVHVTLLGGGFGRRLWADFVTDALQVSKKTKKPVKLVWTREDYIAHDFFRPTSIHKLQGSLSKKTVNLWKHRVVAPSISGQMTPERFKNGRLDRSAVNGASNLPYAIPNVLVDYVMTNTKVPVGWWRSVYNSQNAFANEGFIDELAEAAGKDSFQFRLDLLKDSPRHMGVLKLAAERAGWGKKLGKNKGMGIAVHESFGSWAAMVAEVTVGEKGAVKVDKITSAIDCGLVVNPDGVKAQMESAIVYGLTSTLKGEITIEKGAVVQSNFHDFELLRMDEMPKVNVHIVKSAEPPGGAGEPGLPPVAPAVTNAVFAAIGKRIRRLPIKPEDLI